MNTIELTDLPLLISQAKASQFVLEYLSQFDAEDIDSDSVDLRFEVDDVDTGSTVSIVDECGQAAESIRALVKALESALRANVSQNDHINQQQDRIDQLEKGHNEAARHIHSWRRLANQNIVEREKDIAALTDARRRIAELEARTVTVQLPAHKYRECVNGLLEEAIAYAGTQQLRERLSSRLANFVQPDHPHTRCAAGIKCEVKGE